MATTIEQACEARLGQVLKGKWTLERVLGIGGMAAVYVAQHKIGRREAIKVLHPEVARDAEQRKRFEQEARAANTLTHPGMVEVRDIDATDDGCPFMVMELLEGETLAEMANRLNGLPVPDLLRFVDEILDVLALAHEHGIVHRDIKLGNLFVTTEGRIKVLDFGIARLASSQITRVGARLGTAAYMPPEQIKGEAIDGRADLFAVGATMFRLLAKRRVHEAPTESELLVKMATEPAPLLATVCDAPPDVCLVVDRALAYRASDRYPDARRMQGDVQAVRRGERPPFASSATAGSPAERAAATRAEVARGEATRGDATRAEAPRGRVVGAASASAPTLVGPPSTTLPTGAAPTVARRSADAYAPTGYDLAPPSARGGSPGPGDVAVMGSAATIMPAGSGPGAMPGGMAALGVPGGGVPTTAMPLSGMPTVLGHQGSPEPPPVGRDHGVPFSGGPASTQPSMSGVPSARGSMPGAPPSMGHAPASMGGAPQFPGYPPPSVASSSSMGSSSMGAVSIGSVSMGAGAGPQVVVSPVSMRGHAVPVSDDTALALQPVVPPPPRTGPSPLVLGAIGGAVFFVLAIVLLVAVGDDETAADGAPSADASAPSTTAPRVAPVPDATGPAVTPQRRGPPHGPGHPSHDAPGRGR